MLGRHFSLALLPLFLAAPVAMAQDGSGLGLIFDRLDADGSGEVSQPELAAAREQQFQRADRDGDGKVTAAELAAVQERLARFARLADDGLEQRFVRLDQDRDGAVSQAEFTATPPFFLLVDADGNGAISRTELDRVRAVLAP